MGFSHVRRFLCLVCLCMLMCTSAHAGQKLVVGVEDRDWAGHYRWVEGDLVGIDADIVRATAKKLGYEVVFKPFPWPRVISMAEEKSIDAILDLERTEQRKEFLHIIDTPLSVESTVFWVKKGSSFHYTGQFDSRMRIGLMHGADWSERFAREGTPTIEIFHSHKAAFSSLVAERIDAFGDFFYPTYEQVRRLGFVEQLEPSFPILWELPHYFALTHKSGHEELAERFSKAMVEFVYSSDYERLLERHEGVDLQETRFYSAKKNR